MASGKDRHLGGFILPKSRAKRPHAELGFQFSKLSFSPCQNQKTVRPMTTFSPPTPSTLIQQWFSSTGEVLPQGAVATSGTPVVDTPAGVALPGPKPGGCSQGPGRHGWRGRDCCSYPEPRRPPPTPGETRRRQALRTDSPWGLKGSRVFSLCIYWKGGTSTSHIHYSASSPGHTFLLRVTFSKAQRQPEKRKKRKMRNKWPCASEAPMPIFCSH